MAETSSRSATAVASRKRRFAPMRTQLLGLVLLVAILVPGVDWVLIEWLGEQARGPSVLLLKGLGFAALVAASMTILLRTRAPAPPGTGDGSPEFLQKTIEAMREVVFVTDTDGKLRYVCPNVERVTQAPLAEFCAAANARAVFEDDPGAPVGAGAVEQVSNVPTRLKVGNTHIKELVFNVHRCDIDGDALLYVGRPFSDFDLVETVMHRIFWHSQDPIVFVSWPDRKIVNCNPATSALFGYSRSELIGESTEKLHQSHVTYEKYGTRSLQDIDKNGYAQTEFRMRHRDGHELVADIRTVRVGSGGDRSAGHISIIHDVTARRLAEDLVAIVDGAVRSIVGCRSVEEAYPPILETLCSHSGWAVGEAWTPGSDGFARIAETAANPGAVDYLADTAGLRVSLNDPLLGTVCMSGVPKCIDDFALTEAAGDTFTSRARAHGLRTACAVPLLADGQVHAVLVFLASEAGIMTLRWLNAVATAISPFSALVARVESEEQLRAKEREAAESRESLRRLARRLEDLRETERRELAHELHDQMGSDLTALKIKLGLAEKSFAESKDVAGTLVGVHEVVDRVMGNVRNMATRLRPAVLDDYGLAAGIEWLVEQARSVSDSRIELECQGELPDLDDRQSTTLFRVCQESLTNVFRHANATLARVELTADRDEVILSVSDNGCGMASSDGLHGGSLGIIGMRERLRSVGGALTFERPEEGGTRVIATLPVDAGDKDARAAREMVVGS